VAVWPPEGQPAPPEGLVERMQDYMRKAMREAKVHTSWINPVREYESAVERFIEATLAGPLTPSFLRSLAPFARRVAWLGMLNSISQLVLKVVSPGVPDLYQGTERWDLSLVDPDNRRPVDFAGQTARLAALAPLLDAPREAAVRDLMRRWTDGDVKLFVTAAALRLRKTRRDIFLEGDYRPLAGRGLAAGHIVAFARRRGAEAVLAVVPRLVAGFLGWEHGERPPAGAAWAGTDLVLPPDLAGLSWRNVFTGRAMGSRGEGLPASDVLTDLPWALLTGTDGGPEPSALEVS
jgi:(1->4)-alpha-D-glucan 1-alpha-D-glucosylmutase